MATPMSELATAVNELKLLGPTSSKLSQVQRFIELGEECGAITANEVDQVKTAKLAKGVQGLVTTLTANP